MRKPKTFAVKDRVFLVLAGITLLALLVITIQRLVTFDSGTADFTFGFILLLNTCKYLIKILLVLSGDRTRNI